MAANNETSALALDATEQQALEALALDNTNNNNNTNTNDPIIITAWFADNDTPSGFPMAIQIQQDAEYGDGEMPRCVAELGIIAAAGMIRDKIEWWNKVEDEAIVAKWRLEATGAAYLGGSSRSGDIVTEEAAAGEQAQGLQRIAEEETATTTTEQERLLERRTKQFEYALAESRWLARQFPGPSRPAAVDRVFSRSNNNNNNNLDAGLHKKLLHEIAILRSKPAIGTTNTTDRHPGTPQMVDLVHPSMYAYERGKTQVLAAAAANASALAAPEWQDFIGCGGVTVAAAKPEEPQSRFANVASPTGLQWLPSEFVVHSCDDNGTNNNNTKCSINSYINSLHPVEYPELYDSIGALFCHVVPLLEDVLSEIGEWTATRQHQLPRERPLRVPVGWGSWWDGEPRPQGEQEDDGPYYEYWDDFYENGRTFLHPDIPDFAPPIDQPERPVISLTNRPLQVICKIASLELEPGESYSGGSWHVEGTLDERIVATACVYLESTNVQDEGGRLEFRTAVQEPEYEQSDNAGVLQMFGLVDEDPLVQDAGYCSTRAGSVLAWPNVLQHRVGPVQLVDDTLPGKRTIICFFLVDPTLRIRSTATVPPQQLAWLSDELETLLPSTVVPRQIAANLAGDTLLTYQQACERRDRLMDERRQIFTEVGSSDEKFFERPFSLCEH